MVIHPKSRKVNREAELLERLVAAREIGRHALFFVTGEGDVLPDGTEEASGQAIDEQGRVWSFWLGWDDATQRPAFTEWEQVTPEPAWLRSAEYREARERVGLT